MSSQPLPKFTMRKKRDPRAAAAAKAIEAAKEEVVRAAMGWAEEYGRLSVPRTEECRLVLRDACAKLEALGWKPGGGR